MDPGGAALRLHPDALQELRAESFYYDDVSQTVGDHFDEVVTRRLVLREFPFSVVYRASPDRVVIYAFAHSKRRPGYWRSRLSWSPASQP